MIKPVQIVALGGGIALASVAFVGAFLWVDSTPADDEIAEVGAEASHAASSHDPHGRKPMADAPKPTEVDEGAFQTVDGGVKIADLTVGTGDAPVAGQYVTVHYTGWLQDGTMFDSSVHRGGRPFGFQLETGRVIQGWHKGVAGMKVGGKRQLVIPPDMAYGKRGSPPVIPPDATLVFEVELLELGDIRKVPELGEPNWADATQMAPGIKVLELAPGTGMAAVDGSPVTADLTVWKEDGSLFHSSWNEPRTPGLMVGDGQPLEGIDKGMVGVRAGESRLLQLAPEVAFGEKGLPGQIPPNHTVIVQLDVTKVGEPRVVPSKMVSFDESTMTVTESGLKYVDVVVGDGAAPKAGDTVLAEYSGWLQDGTMFDSSYKRPHAFDFPLGRGAVIKAWDEALSTMKVGGKRIIVAPPELAYGERKKPNIPPGSTLVFEIELTGVNP